jgi:hypothetical protein
MLLIDGDTQMKTKRALLAALALLTLATFISLGVSRGTRKVHAQDETSPQIGERHFFGMVGVTQGQTLRVNVSNIVAINDSLFPPGPTRVAISVINSQGDPVRYRDGSPARRVLMLERGDSAFLDLNADDIQYPPGPTRLQMRALVAVTPPPNHDGNVPPPIGDRTVTSVEVFNNANSRTVVFMSNPGVIRGFNPQPDPPRPEGQ